jgi:hypothetical protein
VSFFNAMGLASADYERAGSTGFGLYGGNALGGRSDAASWLSTAGRRQALPALYRGPGLG